MIDQNENTKISSRSIFVFFTMAVTAQNPFIENKGQLPKEVVSKTLLPSGALFILEGKFIFHFIMEKR